jgi:hypothetical protein
MDLNSYFKLEPGEPHPTPRPQSLCGSAAALIAKWESTLDEAMASGALYRSRDQRTWEWATAREEATADCALEILEDLTGLDPEALLAAAKTRHLQAAWDKLVQERGLEQARLMSSPPPVFA